MMTKKSLIQSPEAIAKMRVAGKLASDLLVMLDEHVRVGISTEALNQIAHDYIVNVQDAIPAPLNYNGFPKSICTSVNHVVCHGIPTENKILKDGDIINIDVTVIKDGYYGDTSKMWVVGNGSIMAERICRVAQEALYAGMSVVKMALPSLPTADVITKEAKDITSKDTSAKKISIKDTLKIWQFNLYDYKPQPDWLNARYWANPENFDKYRW